MSFSRVSKLPFWIAYSADEKERIGIPEGARCYEWDTGHMWNFFDGEWKRKLPDYVGAIDFTWVQSLIGKAYTISKTFSSVANDAEVMIRMKAPAGKSIGFAITVNTTGKASLKTYKGTTYTVDGTTITPFNRNTSFGNQSGVLAYHTPTVNALGTQRADDLVNGGTGPHKAGGSIGDSTVSILAPGDDVLVVIKCLAGDGQTIDANIIINFVEA